MDDRNGAAPEQGGGRTVVVGVDGSDASLAALSWALGEARLRHATLRVVHAWHFPFEMAAGTYAMPAPSGDMERWAGQVVDEALADAGADGAVEIERHVVNGSAALALADAAQDAQLLVVGTRGHHLLTGLFLGSVSQYLVVHAPCPVVVVHGPRHAADTFAGSDASEPAGSDPPSDPEAADPPGSPALVEIPEAECLALLAGKTVGRLVVVHDGVPQAYPVNYALDGRTVAVRTDPGVLLDWATLGPVAFEVDEIDEGTHQGWSVVVHGVGRDVTDGIDAWSERLRRQTVDPWAGGERLHWIAIAAPTFTGRRILRLESATPEAGAHPVPSD